MVANQANESNARESDSLFKLSQQECGSSFKNVNIQIPKLKKSYIFYKLTISILFSLSFKRLR